MTAEEELLGLLAEELRSGGIAATLTPHQGATPAQLVTPIGEDSIGRSLRVHAFFLPDIDDPPVLQYFVALPYAVQPGMFSNLAQFVCTLNADLPLTGFEAVPTSDVIVFRHTQAVSVRPLDPGVVAWTLAMIGAAVREFGDLVEAVAGGFEPGSATDQLAARFEAFSAG
jgi:non-homologous end joining protein Ku